MQVRQWTHLGRDFHPRYPGHSIVIVISTAAATLAGATAIGRQADIYQTVTSAIAAALAAFLGWAISRELDPDHPQSGLVAGAVVAVGQLFLETPDLLGAVWLLGTLRILNGITGLAPKVSDVALYGIGSVVVAWLGSPLLAAVASLAVTVGWILHQRGLWHLWASGSLAAVVAVLVLMNGAGEGAPVGVLQALVLAGGLAACVWALRPGERLHSKVDHGGAPVKAQAVLASIGVAAGVLWLEWILDPEGVLSAWFPLWSALIVAVLYRPVTDQHGPGREAAGAS